jgi:ketosteroid isomerase-like protein
LTPPHPRAEYSGAMSQDNVEIVRKIFDGWSRGDFSVGRDLLTADFEWQQHPEAVEPGPRRGPAIGASLKKIFEIYESFRIVPDRYLDSGDKVVVLAHNRGYTARGGGIELDQAFAYVWTLRAGKLARVEVYEDEAAAFEAAGPPTKA